MFKNTVFMTLSTLVRLLAGVVLFIVLARLLGPEDFGRLMYGFTLASIAVLVIEYGFSQQLLREIGKTPTEVCTIMGRVFLAKILLTFLVIIGGLVAFVFFPKSIEDQQIYWLLFLSCTMSSFADFFNVAFRGIGHFHEETKIATASSIYHFGVILFLAYLHSDLIVLAQGFVVSRVFNLGFSWMAYRRIVGKLEFGAQLFKKTMGMLKSGFPYAADTGFTNLFSQIDVLIVNHYLGAASLGLYQAGMRFLQGACQFAPVLGNVYLPAIAGCGDKPEELNRLAKKLNTQMIFVGAAGWFVFSFGGDLITHLIYGEKYAGLTQLWSYMGLLLFFRYIAASQGVLLTANGAQSVRVLAQILGFLILIFIAPLLIEQYQLIGMLVTMQLTLSALFLIYFATLIVKRLPTGFGVSSFFISVTVLGVAISVFFNQDVVTKFSLSINTIYFQRFELWHSIFQY